MNYIERILECLSKLELNPNSFGRPSILGKRMIGLFDHSYSIFLFLICVCGIVGLIYSGWTVVHINKDLEQLSELIRTLLRNGKVSSKATFNYNRFDIIWRKLLAFYHGIGRSTKVKSDAETLMLGSMDLLNAAYDSQAILQVLSEIIHKTSAPESRFVAVAEISKERGDWVVSAAAGIAKARLEDPFLLALSSLPLNSERHVVYTSAQNGSDFDFRGIGVGLSLFVSIVNNDELIGIVWVGLSEEFGLLSDGRREMLELIVQHAVTSFVAAQKNEEKYKKTEDQKDRILALSHDLKAPSIRALYALRELRTLETNLRPESQSLIAEIEYAIDEQLGLISELFNVDTPTKVISSSAEVEIVGLIKSRIDAFRVVARSVNIELRLGTLQRAKLKFPRDILSRILDNLLSNAIKYTNSGYVQISCKGVGNKLQILVEDTGPGVRPDLVPFLFSSSMRGKEKLENSGQGFGLSVVRKLLEDFGASVTYSEKPGGGSIFSVLVPVATFLDSQNNIQKENGVILIIDDDLMIRTVHQKWLKSLADKIYVAASFSEAASILEFHTPNLIITDINIPNESFYEFTKNVSPEMRVIVLSGNSMEHMSEALINLEFIHSIVEKPVEKKALKDLVASALSSISDIKKYEKAA